MSASHPWRTFNQAAAREPIDTCPAVRHGRPVLMDARERVAGVPPPPKEQPPRNLSGTRDRAFRTLWKASAAAKAVAGHRRGKLPGKGGENSQVPATEGA
jgi:hypothetical protein